MDSQVLYSALIHGGAGMALFYFFAGNLGVSGISIWMVGAILAATSVLVDYVVPKLKLT